MLEVAVIEEIDPRLGKPAQHHQPPEAAAHVLRDAELSVQCRAAAEEDQHHGVVVVGDHVRILVVLLLRRFDDEGVGADAGRRKQEVEVCHVQGHSAEVHPQHQQHAAEHDGRAEPVGDVELLVIQNHRGKIHHQHVGLQQGRTGAQRAAGIAEVCEQIQQEAEYTDQNQDPDRFSLMKQAAEILVRQQLDRQEHQRRRAQEKSGHSGRAGRVDHDLADRIVDRPGYHHPDHHQGIFQVFLHGCTSFISFPALSGGKQCFRLCL